MFWVDPKEEMTVVYLANTPGPIGVTIASWSKRWCYKPSPTDSAKLLSANQSVEIALPCDGESTGDAIIRHSF